MTNKELEKLEIYPVRGRIYWINGAQLEMAIPKESSVSQITEAIYEAGRTDGICKGKLDKIEEIKNVLEIYD